MNFKAIGTRIAPMLLLAFFSSQAMADTYNLVLKQNGTPLTCTVGGFSFTKTVAGTFQTTGTTVNVAANCVQFTNPVPGVGTHLPATNFSTTAQPNAIVQNVVLNGQDQGPNVVGLVGDLNNGLTGANRYVLRLNYSGNGASEINRPFIIFRGPQNTPVATGTYYFRNTNSIPEPSSPLLILAGLLAFGLVMRLRTSRA